jgi:hypothetical protein
MLKTLLRSAELDELRLAWASASYHLSSRDTLGGVHGLMPLDRALSVLEQDDSEMGRYSRYIFKKRRESYDEGSDGVGGLSGTIGETGPCWVWLSEADGDEHGGGFEGLRVTPEARYSPRSLITQASVYGVVHKSLEKLAAGLNPVCWAAVSRGSPYSSFRVSDQVETENDRVIFRDGLPVRKPVQPGHTTTWRGVLFEDVDMQWSGLPINGFKNLLSIDYKYAPTCHSKPITLDFSLYQSLSSSNVSLDRNGGIDIDSGGATVQPFRERVICEIEDTAKRKLLRAQLESHGGDGCPSECWLVEITKSIRFVNLTPHKFGGMLQMGHIMNYNAPYVVSTWMDQAALMGVFKK